MENHLNDDFNGNNSQDQRDRKGFDPNVYVEIGRMQAALKAQEDRSNRQDAAHADDMRELRAILANQDVKQEIIKKKIDELLASAYRADGAREELSNMTIKQRWKIGLIATAVSGDLLFEIVRYATTGHM